MKLHLHVQNADDLGKNKAPKKLQFRKWILSALSYVLKNPEKKNASRPPLVRKLRATAVPFEMTIRLITELESAELNTNYRHKTGATNVISFPYEDDILPMHEFYLGDLAICSQLVTREAEQQQKPIFSHWAHLTVHGVLHLLGYDHEQEYEAQIMEGLETQILQDLEFPDPYR